MLISETYNVDCLEKMKEYFDAQEKRFKEAKPDLDTFRNFQEQTAPEVIQSKLEL